MKVHKQSGSISTAHGTGHTYVVYPVTGKHYYYVTEYSNGVCKAQTFYYRGDGYGKQQCIRELTAGATLTAVRKAIKQSQGV